MEQNNFAQSGADDAHNFANDGANKLTPDEFASRVGTERQTISYHLRKGLLKRYVDNGRISVEPYEIPEDLVDWFLAQKRTKGGAKLAKETGLFSQNDAQVYAPPSQNYAQNDAHISESLMTTIMADRDTRIQKLEESLSGKDEIIERLQQELTAAKVELAEWKGQAKGKDEVIAAKDGTISAMKSDLASKDQAINAANAAVMLMEQQRPSLDVLTPPMIETKPKGLLERLLHWG